MPDLGSFFHFDFMSKNVLYQSLHFNLKSKTDFLNLGIPLLESASTDFVLLEVSSLFRIESQTLSAQLNRKVIPA